MTGVRECQPEAAPVRRVKGEFYVKDGLVYRAPVETKTATGTNISIGFPVCEPSDYIEAENLAACLNEHVALQARVEELTGALTIAEDVLSRFPFSTAMWPNGMHPQVGIEQIRKALAMTLERSGGAT